MREDTFGAQYVVNIVAGYERALNMVKDKNTHRIITDVLNAAKSEISAEQSSQENTEKNVDEDDDNEEVRYFKYNDLIYFRLMHLIPRSVENIDVFTFITMIHTENDYSLDTDVSETEYSFISTKNDIESILRDVSAKQFENGSSLLPEAEDAIRKMLKGENTVLQTFATGFDSVKSTIGTIALDEIASFANCVYLYGHSYQYWQELVSLVAKEAMDNSNAKLCL